MGFLVADQTRLRWAQALRLVLSIQTNGILRLIAVDIIKAVPKKPAPNFADTRKGDIHALEPSGLAPKYLKKKDFGKTPPYLSKRKEELARAQQEYEDYVKGALNGGSMKCLSETERYVI